MTTFTYYAVLLKSPDEDKPYWWFIDFPQEKYNNLDIHELQHAFTKSLIAYLKSYRIAPMATGIVPLIYKVKKYLAEQGRPVSDFLKYKKITINLDVSAAMKTMDAISVDTLKQYP